MVLKGQIWMIFILRGHVGLVRTDYGNFLLLWESVVNLKELMCDKFHIWRLWWSWKVLTFYNFKFGRM